MNKAELKILLQRWVILTALMKGRFRIEPRTGTLLMKPTTTGKKPLHRKRKADEVNIEEI